LAELDIPAKRMESWRWQQFFSYVKVKPGSNVAQLESKFQDYIKKEVHPKTQESGFTYLPFLQPLKDIHLKSADFVYDNAKRGNAAYVKGLTIIAVFVLIIACFNFINLAPQDHLEEQKKLAFEK
jgi:putative ABC transport system permease protein